MAAFIDPQLPELLSAQLHRPKPNYITKHIIRPRFVYEFFKGPGDTIQLDRFHYWADDDTNLDASLTKAARQRSQVQTIGINNSRNLEKDKIILSLAEYTGPSDPGDPNTPSTFQIPLQTLLSAQHKFWEYGQQAFHDSIGSSNLLDDYLRWEDRVYVHELLKSDYTYNPGGVPDAGTYALSTERKFQVEDADQIVADMKARNTPVFEDGNYFCLCSPHFLNHLQRDPEFREIVREYNTVSEKQLVPAAMEFAPSQVPLNPNPWIQGVMGGQANDGIEGLISFPTGFVFRGVRYFVSNNLPKETVTMTYTANTGDTAGIVTGSAARTGELGIFFGPQAIAVGLGGDGPGIHFNNNDDFGRFIIAIWKMYGDWQLADQRFVTVARSFVS